MNFIGRMEDHSIQVDLKYCERCGGLWLRPQGNAGVYCASCQLRLEAMPDPSKAPPCKTRRRKARLRTGPNEQQNEREKFEGTARIENLQGVATTGVWA
jgi:uncharacterized Zn finger protein (UPF0148 family)